MVVQARDITPRRMSSVSPAQASTPRRASGDGASMQSLTPRRAGGDGPSPSNAMQRRLSGECESASRFAPGPRRTSLTPRRTAPGDSHTSAPGLATPRPSPTVSDLASESGPRGSFGCKLDAKWADAEAAMSFANAIGFLQCVPDRASLVAVHAARDAAAPSPPEESKAGKETLEWLVKLLKQRRKGKDEAGDAAGAESVDDGIGAQRRSKPFDAYGDIGSDALDAVRGPSSPNSAESRSLPALPQRSEFLPVDASSPRLADEALGDPLGHEAFSVSVCSTSTSRGLDAIEDGWIPRFGDGACRDADDLCDDAIHYTVASSPMSTANGSRSRVSSSTLSAALADAQTRELLQQILRENAELRSAYTAAVHRISALEEKHVRFLEGGVFDLVNALRVGDVGDAVDASYHAATDANADGPVETSKRRFINAKGDIEDGAQASTALAEGLNGTPIRGGAAGADVSDGWGGSEAEAAKEAQAVVDVQSAADTANALAI